MTADPLTEARYPFERGRTPQAIRDDIYEHVGRDERLLALTIELESAVARAERERMKPCPFCGHPPVCHKNGECVREANDDR